jgi:hypothetical protein
MPEIPYWTRSGTRERVMRSLMATEAAEAAVWYVQQGAYPIAGALIDLAEAIRLSEPSNALTETTRAVPMIRPPMRDDQPTDPAATAVIERHESHAPTTCGVCGELIRWQTDQVAVGTLATPDATIPGMSRWVHVNDRHLGESDHPAAAAHAR